VICGGFFFGFGLVCDEFILLSVKLLFSGLICGGFIPGFWTGLWTFLGFGLIMVYGGFTLFLVVVGFPVLDRYTLVETRSLIFRNNICKY
jgi:hypothetical protein